MSTTKKLSEKLAKVHLAYSSRNYASELAAEARALEERVAELEKADGYASLWHQAAARVAELERLASKHGPAHPIMVKQCLEERDAATARAEAAESKLEKVRARIDAMPEIFTRDVQSTGSPVTDILEILDGEGSDDKT